MRFSGFSFKLGKARLYFSNNKKTSAKAEAPTQSTTPTVNTAQPTLAGVIFRIFLMFIAMNWIAQAWWRGDLSPFICCVLLGAGTVYLMLDYLIFAPHRAEDARLDAEVNRVLQEQAKREALEREAEAKKVAEPVRHVFIPGVLSAPEQQAMLKQLQLEYTAGVCGDGYKAELSMHSDDDAKVVTFLWDNKIVGIANIADTEYIIENFDKITLTAMEIDGGGHDYLGDERPYYVSVFADIAPGCSTPPATIRPVLAMQMKVWGCYDTVPCYISSTGKAHFAWGECKIGRHDPIPMTVYDAEKAGYTPCARCFGD